MCAAVRADPSKSSFFAEKKSTTLADDHVKERFRLDSGPDGPKTKTTKIAGLAHHQHGSPSEQACHLLVPLRRRVVLDLPDLEPRFVRDLNDVEKSWIIVAQLDASEPDGFYWCVTCNRDFLQPELDPVFLLGWSTGHDVVLSVLFNDRRQGPWRLLPFPMGTGNRDARNRPEGVDPVSVRHTDAVACPPAPRCGRCNRHGPRRMREIRLSGLFWRFVWRCRCCQYDRTSHHDEHLDPCPASPKV